MEEGIKTSVERRNKPSNPHHPAFHNEGVVVNFVQLIHQMWWIEFHKHRLAAAIHRKVENFGDVLSPFLQKAAITSSFGKLWISPSPGRPFVAASLVLDASAIPYSTSPMTVDREQARDALATLLEVFAGPNYSGALRDGDSPPASSYV